MQGVSEKPIPTVTGQSTPECALLCRSIDPPLYAPPGSRGLTGDTDRSAPRISQTSRASNQMSGCSSAQAGRQAGKRAGRQAGGQAGRQAGSQVGVAVSAERPGARRRAQCAVQRHCGMSGSAESRGRRAGTCAIVGLGPWDHRLPQPAGRQAGGWRRGEGSSLRFARPEERIQWQQVADGGRQRVRAGPRWLQASHPPPKDTHPSRTPHSPPLQRFLVEGVAKAAHAAAHALQLLAVGVPAGQQVR